MRPMLQETRDKIIEANLDAIIKYAISDTKGLGGHGDLSAFCTDVKGKGCENCKFLFVCDNTELNIMALKEKYPEEFL